LRSHKIAAHESEHSAALPQFMENLAFPIAASRDAELWMEVEKDAAMTVRLEFVSDGGSLIPIGAAMTDEYRCHRRQHPPSLLSSEISGM